jgi:hypothetical protein
MGSKFRTNGRDTYILLVGNRSGGPRKQDIRTQVGFIWLRIETGAWLL